MSGEFVAIPREIRRGETRWDVEGPLLGAAVSLPHRQTLRVCCMDESYATRLKDELNDALEVCVFWKRNE